MLHFFFESDIKNKYLKLHKCPENHAMNQVVIQDLAAKLENVQPTAEVAADVPNRAAKAEPEAKLINAYHTEAVSGVWNRDVVKVVSAKLIENAYHTEEARGVLNPVVNPVQEAKRKCA